MIAQSEARQGGMQGTKSLTPACRDHSFIKTGHKMIYMSSIYMDSLPLPVIHEEQLSAARER